MLVVDQDLGAPLAVLDGAAAPQPDHLPAGRALVPARQQLGVAVHADLRGDLRIHALPVDDLRDEPHHAPNARTSVRTAQALNRAARLVRDGQVPALLGVAQALLALAIGFGLNVGAEGQAVIMSFVGAVAAAFVRTQVVARAPAETAPVAPLA
jgi:hypothetical protein